MLPPIPPKITDLGPRSSRVLRSPAPPGSPLSNRRPKSAKVEAPGGGQNAWRPRAWPSARECCSCCPGRLGGGRVFAGLGQAADLPVAHPVEDQSEQLAGGGDLRDVLRFLAPAGDDGVLRAADHAVFRDALDGLDQRPAQQPGALL